MILQSPEVWKYEQESAPGKWLNPRVLGERFIAARREPPLLYIMIIRDQTPRATLLVAKVGNVRIDPCCWSFQSIMKLPRC